jgi:hypothetical protein
MRRRAIPAYQKPQLPCGCSTLRNTAPNARAWNLNLPAPVETDEHAQFVHLPQKRA